MPEHDVPAPLRQGLAPHYAVQRELGRGGMATVYLAHDQRHDRPVAIKVLAEDQAAALGAVRFDREIKVLARLRHPFVLPLHDSGETGGTLYFVMPYIDGESLRARLEREGPLGLGDVVAIARNVADALDYAHGEGIVHRDVKPENILLSRHGHALLADFGIARGTGPAAGVTTQVGMAIGTVSYMSPEQALGEAQLDGRSDVYALGCVVFEMLSGQPPFVGSNPLAIIAQHISTAMPELTCRPGQPAGVATTVARALEKDAARRFPTAGAFVQALQASSEGNARLPAALNERLSIAVLPLTGSSDPETEFFGEGMTEELINVLARVEGLRVVSRTSTLAFGKGGVSMREIGDRLDVGFVLEASVRRSGRRLRVTARLVRVADDSTLWSETYERQLEDVFAVQDDITRRIVDTITQALQLGHLRGVAGVPQPKNLETYDLYLLGRHHWYKRTEVGMRRALELFEQAVSLDPSYAPAHSGIADASALLASWQFAVPDEMYPRAMAAARRAIELDSASADAHASLGFVKLNWEWDWEGAAAELRRAIALNPSHETAHRWLSAFLAAIGRTDEAIPVARRAMALDPVSVLPRMNLGIIHFLSGRYDEAAAEFQRVLDQDPGFIRGYAFLAAGELHAGRGEVALAAARRAVELSNHHHMMVVVLATVLGVTGRHAEARTTMATVAADQVQPMYAAMYYAGVGEVDAMFAELERGVAERSDWMYSVANQPWFKAWRSHPRFVALLEGMRLTPTPE